MTALTSLLWFAFSLVLENGITSSQGTNSDERVFGFEYEYGKEAMLHCSNKAPDFEIKNCEWRKGDGSSCSAVSGQGTCEIWNNTYITYSKTECKLTFLKLDIDQGGEYKCNLTATNDYSILSKLTTFKPVTNCSNFFSFLF